MKYIVFEVADPEAMSGVRATLKSGRKTLAQLRSMIIKDWTILGVAYGENFMNVLGEVSNDTVEDFIYKFINN